MLALEILVRDAENAVAITIEVDLAYDFLACERAFTHYDDDGGALLR